MRRCLACLLLLLFAAGAGAADDARFQPRPYDWPQWRGPNRDAVSHEKGLLQDWPTDGPRLLWSSKNANGSGKGLGRGWSSVSVAAGRVFTMGDRGPDEFVIALDDSTGKQLWATRVGSAWKGGGPRCTPTVDGDRVYALGGHGDLLCLDVASGKERWHKDLVNDFGGKVPRWGYSESPLIDGDHLIATPGGRQATLVALDKKTGATVWKAQVPRGDSAEYSSIVAADVEGQRQYIQFMKAGVVGVAARDGKYLWRYDQPANGTANCATPIFHANEVFAASAYGRGGGLARLVHAGDTTRAEPVYATKNMKNHHGGMVLVDRSLYGANGGNGERGILVCMEFDKPGKVMWESSEAGKGSIAYADGRLYYRNEKGPMLLVEATPKGYVEHGRFTPPDCTRNQVWAHPVLANGRLYLRDQDVLLCYDLKGP
jgi:outer membrane protein assembly factor BamB